MKRSYHLQKTTKWKLDKLKIITPVLYFLQLIRD